MATARRAGIRYYRLPRWIAAQQCGEAAAAKLSKQTAELPPPPTAVLNREKLSLVL